MSFAVLLLASITGSAQGNDPFELPNSYSCFNAHQGSACIGECGQLFDIIHSSSVPGACVNKNNFCVVVTEFSLCSDHIATVSFRVNGTVVKNENITSVNQIIRFQTSCNDAVSVALIGTPINAGNVVCQRLGNAVIHLATKY